MWGYNRREKKTKQSRAAAADLHVNIRTAVYRVYNVRLGVYHIVVRGETHIDGNVFLRHIYITRVSRR